MNSSNLPPRITKAFSVNGEKNTIPTDSSSSTDSNGTATFDKGFPPVTMLPLSAGGIPPSGKDVNGVLYSVTLQQQWYNAGMTYPYNQSFAATIGGYPKGAVLPNSIYTGQWLNLNESNANSPESLNGSSTGWVPINNYGITTLSGLSGTSINLSSIQAAKDRIVLNGVLTSNINIVFPSWIKSWVVANNCTGNFNVTCTTVSGSGVIVPPGIVSRLFCDGINISDETYNPNNDMVGMIATFSMNSAPTGWLVANGSEVSRITYARLFSRIGTLYGAGDGVNTFNLPDPRGEFPRYFGGDSGVDSGRLFGSKQSDQLKAHTHEVSIRRNGDTTSSSVNDVLKSGSGYSFQSGSTGGNENRPRNIAFLACIKY